MIKLCRVVWIALLIFGSVILLGPLFATAANINIRWQVPTEQIIDPLDDTEKYNVYVDGNLAASVNKYAACEVINSAAWCSWEYSVAAGKYSISVSAVDYSENESAVIKKILIVEEAADYVCDGCNKVIK